MPGCSTVGRSPPDRRVPRRRHQRPDPQRAVPAHDDEPRHRARPAVAGLEPLLEHAGRRHRRPLRPGRAALVRRRGLRVEHDRDRPGGRRRAVRAASTPRSAGGTDALARLTFSGFNALRLMDPAPCRPFDRGRAGMNIGEGAGILVLEEMERASARGAHIYGELAGYSFACEAYHPTAPEPDGRPVRAVMLGALQDAGSRRRDAVDHVNAHGTATPQNDRAEARAFTSVFGARTSAGAGDLAEVDARPLPGRRRRARGGGAGADGRRAASSRRRSITAKPIPSARSTSSPTPRASSASGAACRRRWGSAATTRRW